VVKMIFFRNYMLRVGIEKI